MRRKSDIKCESGFTLLELLVVLAILALVASLAVPSVLKYLSGAKVSVAETQIKQMSGAVDLFFLDQGRYPTEAEGLEILVQQPSRVESWNGPYLNSESIPKDPWGNLYHYRRPGSSKPFEVYSLGADGEEGGDDEDRDLSN